MKKKRILHICLSEAWGGLEMAVVKWNEVLDKNGHSNFNICTPETPLAKSLKKNSMHNLEWDSSIYFSPDFTYKLSQFLRQEKIDVIMLQSLRDLWLVSPALIGLPHIQLIGFAQMLIGVKKTDFLHRIVYSRLNHLCVLTNWQKQNMAPYLPVPYKKYKVIPNFVDCEKFTPESRTDEFRKSLGLGEHDFAIGVVGRIDPQKGQREAIKAFAKILPRFLNCKLFFVGTPTQASEESMNYHRYLENQVTQLELQGKVHFLGFRKDVHKVMANLDLFVLPSHKEAFGFVVVEAMACGTPVVGTNAGGVTEILGGGTFGRLCEPMDEISLGKELFHMLEHPEERHALAHKALKHVRDTFDSQKVYEEFEKLLG